MDELNGLILGLSPWLLRRCTLKALELPGVFPEDLYQAVILRFYVRAQAGWFDQNPTVSVEAQAKTLMIFCLRHEITAIRRYRARLFTDDGDEQGDGKLGRLPAPEAPEPGIGHDVERMLELLETATTPVRRLCLLSRDVPYAVLLRHVRQAKAYKVGGADMVRRPAEQAYAMLAEHREDESLRGWKRVLGAIFYGVGPLDQVPEEDIDKAAGTVQRQADRAIEDLQKRLPEAGGVA